MGEQAADAGCLHARNLRQKLIAFNIITIALMAADPVLVLQMRRLGDLILTFPLLEDIRARYPGQPILVAAEEHFYKGLEKLSPDVIYFPASRIQELAQGRYAAIINLGSGPEAAICAGKAHAPLKIGQINDGSLHIAGFWQIYRANLTLNNRHNTFHWADLNRLDLPNALPLPVRASSPLPSAGKKRIGLVVGASVPSKRPDALFWGRLASRLTRDGFSPVFLGGKAEIEAGARAAAIAGLDNSNFCGKLSLRELASLMQGLALCITPDTGPMHLASWMRCPTLNLSMGPVHANETGPALPGQWVLRYNASCVGCWKCARSRMFCKNNFTPQAVAQAAAAIINGEQVPAARGLDLLRTGRDALGLAELAAVSANVSVRPLLENFWKHAFLAFADESHYPAARQQAGDLLDNQAALARNMRKNVGKMLSQTIKVAKGARFEENFWKNQPWHSRLFAGHCQLWLQNADSSRQALLEVLQRQEALQDLLSE